VSKPSTRNHPRAAAGDEAVRRAVGMVVAGLHAAGKTEAEIRGDVNAAVKEALEGDAEWQRPVDFGRGGPETALSTAGVFRIVLSGLGIDRGDQRAQETFYDAVKKAIDPALTDAVFGIDSAGG
jgi:hypothetical protein